MTASLRYDVYRNVDVTRHGIFIYRSATTAFHLWELMTAIDMNSVKTDEKAKPVNSIVEGLRGQPILVEGELGATAWLYLVTTDRHTLWQQSENMY